MVVTEMLPPEVAGIQRGVPGDDVIVTSEGCDRDDIIRSSGYERGLAWVVRCQRCPISDKVSKQQCLHIERSDC